MVKEKVKVFFKQRFGGEASKQARLEDNVGFNRILEEDNDMLVGRITEEKIKHAM